MRSLVIGIAGGSGSGKTTVATRIAESLLPGTAAIVEHDSYYRDRPDLSFEDRARLNFDHPESLETNLLVKHLTLLRSGSSVEVPVYDFRTHRRSSSSVWLSPRPILIVEGILVFVEERLREQLDIKIYVDTDADIRAFRRIRRDIEQRGRTFDLVREQYYCTVRPMHLQFVEPSKRWADIIIPEGGNNRVGVGLVIAMVQHARSSDMSTLAWAGPGCCLLYTSPSPRDS